MFTVLKNRSVLHGRVFVIIWKRIAGGSSVRLYDGYYFSWLGPELFRLLLGPPGGGGGSTDDFLLLQISSGVVWQTRDLH